ncbi:MAG: hypothetical protein ACF788_06070, partial [Novipirellula sp. JB048]
MIDLVRPLVGPFTLGLCFLVGPIARAQEPASAAAGTPTAVPISDADREAILARWTPSIVALEARDATVSHNEDAILFIGSSSILRWDSIAEDMAPYRSIERGFGGSKFSDVAVFANRLLKPHHYRGLVIFVANDVSGRPGDHSLEQIET